MVSIDCKDLGIANCTYRAQAENMQEAVKKMVAHLREHHDLNMPSASEILWAEDVPTEATRTEKQAVVEEAQTQEHKKDEGVHLVVKRLMELLKPFEDSQDRQAHR